MKIAVTTAGGQLGRAIIREAVKNLGRENVLGLARRPETAQDLGIRVLPGDYNQKSDFVNGLPGIEVLLMISGMDAPDRRIRQHRNVIEGAREAGVGKIVYTSIFGQEGKCAFDPIILSNRQTEKDLQRCGISWIIGRNGLYIDADLEALPEYREAGKIANCAGKGKCGYTSREELARAYLRLITSDSYNGAIYNLCGPSVTQGELTQVINEAFGEHLAYEEMTVEDYERDRKQAHGEFLGTIIAGIYEGIRKGVFEISSDFETVCGREHLNLREMVEEYKQSTSVK